MRRGPLGGQTWRAYIKDSTQVVVKSSAKKSVARRASSSSAQSSNYRGVSWQASKGQWRARIKLGGKNPVKLGLFDSEVDAARAYDAAAHQAGRVHDANFGSKTAAEAAATAEAEAAAATTTPPTALLDSSGYQRASLPGDGRSPGEEMVPRWMLLGAPGAGKGTYSKALSAAFGGVPIVGTGDMLRAVIASGSDEGKRLAAFSDKGQLVPDEDVLRLLGARLAEPDVLEQGFMLDGFPRTVGQAEALGAIMELTLVLNIVVPDEHVVAKLLGRSGENSDSDLSIASMYVNLNPMLVALQAATLVVRATTRRTSAMTSVEFTCRRSFRRMAAPRLSSRLRSLRRRRAGRAARRVQRCAATAAPVR